MSNTAKILFLALFTLALSSCDYVRMLAGRPTSEELLVKKQYIDQQNQRARAEALAAAAAAEAAAQYTADSLAARDALEEQKRIITSDRLQKLRSEELDRTFYIMVGSFSQNSNAVRMVSSLAEAGYDAIVIPYTNGVSAVAVNPSDDIVVEYKTLLELVGKGLCPAESWILEII